MRGEGVKAPGGDEPGRQGVALWVLAVGLEAAVRLQCGGYLVGVVLAQVDQDLAQRLPQRVDIQAMEAGPLRLVETGVAGV